MINNNELASAFKSLPGELNQCIAVTLQPTIESIVKENARANAMTCKLSEKNEHATLSARDVAETRKNFEALSKLSLQYHSTQTSEKLCGFCGNFSLIFSDAKCGTLWFSTLSSAWGLVGPGNDMTLAEEPLFGIQTAGHLGILSRTGSTATSRTAT